MNKFTLLLQRLMLKLLKSRKAQIITAINKKIDIPFADENDEKELLEFMWDGIEAGFKEGIK